MGVIIGNTGAEVLTTMLSWVQGRLIIAVHGVCVAAAVYAAHSLLLHAVLGARWAALTHSAVHDICVCLPSAVLLDYFPLL